MEKPDRHNSFIGLLGTYPKKKTGMKDKLITLFVYIISFLLWGAIIFNLILIGKLLWAE